MLTLYQYPGGDRLTSVSPPCMKVEMALRLIGAEFRVENLTSLATVRRVSETGRLPVLEAGGVRTPDSIAILDRLEGMFPDAPLWPVDPARRVRDRLWDHYGTDSLYWLGFYLRWIPADTAESFFRAMFGRQPWVVRFLIRRTLLPGQRRRARLHGVGGKSGAQVRAEIDRAFDTVVAGLEGGPFLQGRDRPGRGDLACVALLVQAGFRNSLPATMEQVLDRPSLPAFCRRVLEACSLDVPGWLV